MSDSSTSSTCNSSLSLPSSVHVVDVTHDQCIAQEHAPSHGVSGTANETNVKCSNISEDTEGTSSISSYSKVISRKRPATMTNESTPPCHRSKRSALMYQENNGFYKAITDVVVLQEYLKKSNENERRVMCDQSILKNNTCNGKET